MTGRFVARLGLSPETTAQLIDLQKDFRQRSRTIERNTVLSREERNAQLAALGSEAQTRTAGVVGKGNLDAYKKQGGSWLNDFPSNSPPAPKPP